jgi:4-amino-4-deoxy-L-arabinose transferase-like glycosyltransferase
MPLPQKDSSLPRQERSALAAILVLAAALRTWRLEQNAFGNPYYAAAVRSMLLSWHNFFYVSFDPAGFVSVDKPPLALWLQAVSAKLFGFSSLSLMLPQAVLGTLSVYLVYRLVRPTFGAASACISGFAMAMAPVAVAVDRFNNVDSCLVLVLLLACGAILKASERSSRAWLLAAAGLVGLAFNAKMLAAFVVLPTFYLLYFCSARKSWMQRGIDLALASVILGCVSMSWTLAVDLTPASQRPYVGSSQDNSMVGLALGWNGFQRLMQRGRGAGRGTPALEGETPTAETEAALISTPAAEALPAEGQRIRHGFPGGRGGMGLGAGTPGPLRMADPVMAAQASWLLPLILVGLLLASRQTKQGWPLSVEHQSLVLWTGIFLTYAAVFSAMQGAMHTYYLVLLAPPLCALFGIAVRALWFELRDGRQPLALPIAVLGTAVWQLNIVAESPEWGVWLAPVICLLSLAAVGCLALPGGHSAAEPSNDRRKLSALSLGLVALLIAPGAWALTPLLAPSTNPEAAPPSGERQRRAFNDHADERDLPKLLSFLRANRHGEAYLVAAQNSRTVAPLIIHSGETAVALGGFSGSDPILTPAQFMDLVGQQRFRFMLLGQNGFGRGRGNRGGRVPQEWGGFGGPGRGGPGAEIAAWVRAHGKPVPNWMWQASARQPGRLNVAENQASQELDEAQPGAEQLYDLRPEAGLAGSPAGTKQFLGGRHHRHRFGGRHRIAAD